MKFVNIDGVLYNTDHIKAIRKADIPLVDPQEFKLVFYFIDGETDLIEFSTKEKRDACFYHIQQVANAPPVPIKKRETNDKSNLKLNARVKQINKSNVGPA